MSDGFRQFRVAEHISAVKERYSVKPDFYKLGEDFGNGVADRKIFQIDENYRFFISEKYNLRNKRQINFYSEHNFLPETRLAVTDYIVNTLVHEYPNFFEIENPNGEIILRNRITGELVNTQGREYYSSIDALASQIQEDIAVMQLDKDSNYFSAGHICFPSGWAVEDKIGKNFSFIHEPVPGMNTRIGQSIVEAIVEKGPFVRFVFGLSEDNELNHHPLLASGKEITFDENNPRLFLRIERQTTSPLPKVRASLFTIRLYTQNCSTLPREKRITLANFIDSMTSDQLKYKGLSKNKSSVVDWLRV